MNKNIQRKPKIEKPTSLEEIDNSIKRKVIVVEEELQSGLNFIKEINKSVTFFGSARTTEDEEDYKKARNLASRIVSELGYAVVTGGSSGIMEAANRGAYESGGKSVGLNIRLPKEQITNNYMTEHMSFHYFFIRKVCLAFSAETYVYLPGGFGTLDELFEMLTLIQTGKTEKAPVILYGKEYWGKLDNFIKKVLLKEEKIDPEDIKLYTITDNADEIIDIIKNAPIRTGLR